MDVFGQIRMDWGDMFEIEVFPAVTGEQGMEMARQAMSGQGENLLIRSGRLRGPGPRGLMLVHRGRKENVGTVP